MNDGDIPTLFLLFLNVVTKSPAGHLKINADEELHNDTPGPQHSILIDLSRC